MEDMWGFMDDYIPTDGADLTNDCEVSRPMQDTGGGHTVATPAIQEPERACPHTTIADTPEGKGAVHMLNQLLGPAGGRPRSERTPKSTRKRVTRKDGFADKVGALLTAIISEVNAHHLLDLGPLTERDIMMRSQEGREVINSSKVAGQTRVMAQAAVDIMSVSGRECKSDIVGMMAAPNREGQLTAASVGVMSSMSMSTVYKSRARVTSKGVDALGRDTAGPPAKRNSIPTSESVLTRKWMCDRNPSRSGDKKKICWMVKDKEDFYFEDYRSIEGQFELYELALTTYACPERIQSLRSPSNQWERNLKKYAGTFLLSVCVRFQHHILWLSACVRFQHHILCSMQMRRPTTNWVNYVCTC
jgi:hypothetical protein